MSENSNWLEPKDDRTADQIISDRIEMLGAVFSRKVSPEMITVFQEALEGYPKDVLKKAFVKAERELERFPTPKMMRQICNEEMPSQSWRYNLRPAKGKDPEGRGITVLIDPDPLCAECREPRSFHPIKRGKLGIECFTYDNGNDSHILYRAQDCNEGRAFLAALKELGKKRPDLREPGQEG